MTDYSRGVEQHLKMLFLPAYVTCIVEPPAGERPRSIAHGSAGNELVGRLYHHHHHTVGCDATKTASII